MPASRSWRGDRVAGVLLPFVLDGDQFVLEVGLAGFRHQLLGAGRIARLLGQRIVFGMDRADVVVLADRAAPVVAELQDGLVVDGHLQRVAHPLVVIGLVRDVGARNERRRRRDLRFRQPILSRMSMKSAGVSKLRSISPDSKALTVALKSVP